MDDGSSRQRVWHTLVTLDDLLLLLANEERRHLLYCLEDETVCTLEDAARDVAASVHGVDASDLADDELARVRTAIRHAHLPRLRQTAVVEYDERNEMLRFDHNSRVFESLLEFLRGIELDGDDARGDGADAGR